MPALEQLTAAHAEAVLAFERANRAYFAASVSDRGQEYFERFADQHGAMLAEQEAGLGAYYVLVAEDGSVLGRFNLYRFQDGTAEVGYRVAQHVAGRGVTTATVLELCRLAAARHGLRTVRAATSRDNVASQRVLAKAGFVPAGPADPADLGGKPGTWYQRGLLPQPGEAVIAGRAPHAGIGRVRGVATPSFILELRSLIGTRPLWLSVAIAVVVDDQGRILLHRRADSGTWALPGGIIEPGEEPADAAARECFEETGVAVVPETVTSLTVSPLHTFANGDQVQSLEITFRCRPVGGEARVNDDESLEVAWFPHSALPELSERTRRLLDRATSGAPGADFAFSGPPSEF